MCPSLQFRLASLTRSVLYAILISKHYLRFLHHQGTQQKCRNKYTYRSRGFQSPTLPHCLPKFLRPETCCTGRKSNQLTCNLLCSAFKSTASTQFDECGIWIPLRTLASRSCPTDPWLRAGLRHGPGSRPKAIYER